MLWRLSYILSFSYISNLNITKFQKFVEWSHMDLNLSKCAMTCCPNKSKLKPNTFKAYIQSQNITYKSKNFPTLTQNKPYTYLGIHLMPSLKWKLQKDITLQKAKQHSHWGWFISAKYNGSLHLPKLKQQACTRSPIAITLFLLGREYEIHITTTNRAFPIKKTPLELVWRSNPINANLTDNAKTKSQHYLDKLYTYGITTLPQIQNTKTKTMLTLEEFRTTHKHIPKVIKDALQWAHLLFPPPTTPTPHGD